MENLKNNLRRIRRAKDMTQVRLSELTGIHATQISNFEAGRRKPNMVNLVLLAEHLGCSLDNLVNGEDDEDMGDISALRDGFLKY